MSITPRDFESLSASVGMFHAATNVGVIDTGSGLYVIDTGAGEADGLDILSALQTLYPGRKLAAIINTHAHADHYGGNNAIVHLTGAEVWAPYKEGRLMEFPEAMTAMYWGARPFRELEGQSFAAREACRADRALGGEPLDLGTVRMECIPLPGHYYDQAGILVHDRYDGRRAFFLGDGFFGMGMLKKYWIPFMCDPAQFRESVQRIEDTAADVYVPSHGGTYTADTIHAIAEHNIMVTLETEILILRLLREAPRTHEELLKAVADYAGITLRLGQFVLIGSTLRSYLGSLRDRGLADYTIEGNRMLWKAAR